MSYYAGSRLEASDEPSPQLLAKANKVFVNGRSSNNAIEKLVAEVEIRLPAAERNANPETKTVMVAKLIKQLKIHLESLGASSGPEHLLRRAREFLRKDDGTEWVQTWFARASTRETRVPSTSPAPTVTTPQTLPIPTRDEGRERRASLHNIVNHIVNQPSIDEQLLRWLPLEPGFRDAVMSRPPLAASSSETMTFQAVVEGHRLPAGHVGRMRQDTAMLHRRNDSAGHHTLRACSCGMVHGGPTTSTTVIVLQPHSKRAMCFYLFLFFWQLVFFFYGSRASSSKA